MFNKLKSTPKECCCRQGHTVYPSISNLSEFREGFPARTPVGSIYYSVLNCLPPIKTEGVCSRCNSVVRQVINLRDTDNNHYTRIIYELMYEIGELKAARKPKPDKK